MRTCFLLLFAAALIAFAFRPFAGCPCGVSYKTMHDSVYNGGDIIDLPPVYFNLAKCTLLADKDSVFNQTDSLRRVVQFINDHPAFTFEVRTHTDTVNPNSSQRWTQCRSQSVVARLIELGADKNRLLARGMGDTEPLCVCSTIHLPSGDSVVADAVLTHRFIATRKAKKNDWEYLRMLNRRTDLRIITIGNH